MSIFQVVDPATGVAGEPYPMLSAQALAQALDDMEPAAAAWRDHAADDRGRLLLRLADVLESQREALATRVTAEMGKLIKESRAEVDKCVWACRYFAEHGPAMLDDESIASDASRSYISWQPLGIVLAIMPWNFPLWQVLRCAIPAFVTGNTIALKPAANVPGCALALERCFHAAGFPEHVFRVLLISHEQTRELIADRRIAALAVTGSAAAGRQIAALAGQHLKKTVLELGGSDPFIVLEDADLDATVHTAVVSRFMNAGQSCNAAKRFIVVKPIAEVFMKRFRRAVERLVIGPPLEEDTTLAPMARADLRDQLHQQVLRSIDAGAVVATGCRPAEHHGIFYLPSILDHVTPGMPAHDEELFGPVAAVIRVPDEQTAIEIANSTQYGLGASIWTTDVERGEQMARRIAAGNVFVNGLVKSDPRLPFGGIKDSGYGRELSYIGVREFVNVKTIWIK